jgi:hypothetical protein
MTSVAEVEKEPAGAGGPSEAQLLDVLYEVMAHGAHPKGSPTLAAVERFLHEHARARKPVAELAAFCKEHGLPTDATSFGAEQALTELAQGFQRERSPASASFSLDSDSMRLPAPSESGPLRKIEPPAAFELPAERTQPRVPAPAAALPKPAPTSRILLVAATLCAALLGSVALFNFQRARELEHKLNEARLQQRTTDTALTSLEQRAERLKSALEGSEVARAQLSARFDDFVTKEAQERAAESVALERILGKRFENLRTKALADALAGGEAH